MGYGEAATDRYCTRESWVKKKGVRLGFVVGAGPLAPPPSGQACIQASSRAGRPPGDRAARPPAVIGAPRPRSAAPEYLRAKSGAQQTISASSAARAAPTPWQPTWFSRH